MYGCDARGMFENELEVMMRIMQGEQFLSATACLLSASDLRRDRMHFRVRAGYAQAHAEIYDERTILQHDEIFRRQILVTYPHELERFEALRR